MGDFLHPFLNYEHVIVGFTQLFGNSADGKDAGLVTQVAVNTPCKINNYRFVTLYTLQPRTLSEGSVQPHTAQWSVGIGRNRTVNTGKNLGIENFRIEAAHSNQSLMPLLSGGKLQFGGQFQICHPFANYFAGSTENSIHLVGGML